MREQDLALFRGRKAYGVRSLHSVESLLENFDVGSILPNFFARGFDPFLLERVFWWGVRFDRRRRTHRGAGAALIYKLRARR